ncbi:hypothetical protein C1280_13285 [Gemmata obscuriglobus]|uniref:DUF3108 domain-containing protein n=2 Tax=Gemmata obscuriglobus TaxID=114 RepID=A0A2Z3H448_9BACT|nr:hypothetical protein C1280_13285 [Gemmata obscuriglobus]
MEALMRHVPLIVLGLALPTTAAPVPKDAGKNLIYFPTVVGAKWVYEDERGGEEAVEVSAVEKDGDELVVSRKGVDGTSTRYTQMIVSTKGLRQPKDAFNDKPEPVWVLKCGLRAGESWETPSGKRTLHEAEEVKVPAGTFKALRVVVESGTETLTSWYAPGVGEVKRTQKRCGTVTVIRSLKSFTPGKK